MINYKRAGAPDRGGPYQLPGKVLAASKHHSADQLKIIANLFSHDGAFSREFWQKSVEDQFAELETKQGRGERIKRWIKVLKDGFGLESKDIGVELERTTFNKQTRMRIWSALSSRYRPFIGDAGISSEQAARNLHKVANMRSRSRSIGAEEDEGKQAEVKTALVMEKLTMKARDAREKLFKHDGSLNDIFNA